MYEITHKETGEVFKVTSMRFINEAVEISYEQNEEEKVVTFSNPEEKGNLDNEFFTIKRLD